MAFVTYPLNNIEYSAQDAELFHVTRTSGVYAKNSFDASASGSDKTVVIGPGIGWIKNGEFSGKVIAQKEAVPIELGLPDSVYPRIDAIVIQFDANNNATDIVVKTGTASSKPIAPPVVRTESVYELHLYHVRRNPGVSYVTSSDITDLRLNSAYCGLMADSITKVDTDKIEEQISTLIKSLENAIADVKNGSAYLQKDGSTPMTGNLNMGKNRISNLAYPEANSDAVPVSYVKKLEKAYITETGVSGIWRYVKLNSGLCFCFGRVTQSLVLNTASGSNYVNANTLGKEAFPFQFSSILCYTVDCDNSMGAWVVKSGYATLTNAGGYKIMRTTATTDARDYHVSYFVIGTISTS